jgi:O-acetyl-ADP-ribose deacetylase (regulator of RNase III)
VAFPSISTGAYGYPVGQAAPVALGAVIKSLNLRTGIELVRFVLFDRWTFQVYQQALERLHP